MAWVSSSIAQEDEKKRENIACYECDSISSNEQVILDFVAFEIFSISKKIVESEIGNHVNETNPNGVSSPNLMQLKSI